VTAITAPGTTAAPRAATPADRSGPRQYSLRRIAAVWAAAALPIAFLSWMLAPRLADRLDGQNQLTKALLLCLTAGLIWQFVLVAVLVGREQRSLRWSVVRRALWLEAPRSPRTGRREGRVWLVLPLLIAGLAAEELIPQVHHAAARDFGAFLDSHAGHVFLALLGLVRRHRRAAGVLFAVYHLHVPWIIPSSLVDTFLLA
jgi:uncharacterized protein